MKWKPGNCSFSRWACLRAGMALVALCMAATVDAQNTAPNFSHGPTIQFFAVDFDSTGDAESSMLTAGAGYSFNFNFFPSLDGTIRHLTLGVPVFMQIPANGEFAYSLGVTLGTFNNLLSIGAVAELVDTDTDTGLLLGDFSRSNVRLVFSVGFNLGGGSQPTAARVAGMQKAGVPVDRSPPPAYLKF